MNAPGDGGMPLTIFVIGNRAGHGADCTRGRPWPGSFAELLVEGSGYTYLIFDTFVRARLRIWKGDRSRAQQLVF